MKIYVASSWRNGYQHDVVEKLRALGHEVYDFRAGGDGWSPNDGDGGFAWSSIDPQRKDWTPEAYVRALDHPLAKDGFNHDMGALRKADCCIMVMPCGPSASMEMGWAVGAGKIVAVYAPDIREPDLMVKMADYVTTRWDAIDLWLRVPMNL